MNTHCQLRHLVWHLWWATPKRFLYPGLYWRTKRIVKVPRPPQLIEFPEQTVIIAKDQPQYRPLPAHRFPGPDGRIAFCWKLGWRDRLKVLRTGKIWHEVLTFNQALQPQLLRLDKPEMSIELNEVPK